jgi:hypothetical protein
MGLVHLGQLRLTWRLVPMEAFHYPEFGCPAARRIRHEVRAPPWLDGSPVRAGERVAAPPPIESRSPLAEMGAATSACAQVVGARSLWVSDGT